MSREPHANDNSPAAGALAQLIEARSRQSLIGRGLREWYDDVAREPVPAHLLQLVERISGVRKRPVAP